MRAVAQTGQSHDALRHPPIRDMRDLVAFRLSVLAAASDRVGQNWLKAEFGLSIREWRVLGMVGATEPARFGDVGHDLQLDKGQLSRLAKALVDRGLVESRVDADDQRAVRLVLTASGRDVHDRALKRALQRNELVLSALTPGEAATLVELLDKLQPHMEHRADTEIEAGHPPASTGKNRPRKRA
ncbi:MarR family winged helix-turn-helix transcriptional regulator [Amorphus coralli]|uniref:MarR family winged helix-turn-helix transcriptional regulator n=1 Tax=Amorphus coralli TaxID=340680 RepID=UPI00036D0AC1|nr:MarR family winged helix-turn-helix transcriptional regulator [Amorphus coralli]